MRKLFSTLFALAGTAAIMLQVGPHDAGTNFCNWLSIWTACKQSLPEWFDRWPWTFPVVLLIAAFATIVWTPSVHLLRKSRTAPAPKEKIIRYARQWKSLSDDIYSEIGMLRSNGIGDLPSNFKSLPEAEKDRIWRETTNRQTDNFRREIERMNRRFDARIQQAYDQIAELDVLPPQQFRAVNSFGYKKAAQIIGSEALKILDKYNEPH